MASSRRPDRLVPLWSGALAAQLALLAWLAGLGVAGALAAAALGLAFGGFALRRAATRWPGAVAMLALGGLGMTLGWWADLGFTSAAATAAHARAASDPLWCRAPAAAASLAGLPGLGHVVSWMNAGMLVFGMPAVALAHRASDAAARHAAGELVACALAMIAGMTAGSRLALLGAQRLDPTAIVLLDYAGMLAGMALGMALARRVFPPPSGQPAGASGISTSTRLASNASDSCQPT